MPKNICEQITVAKQKNEKTIVMGPSRAESIIATEELAKASWRKWQLGRALKDK